MVEALQQLARDQRPIAKNQGCRHPAYTLEKTLWLLDHRDLDLESDQLVWRGYPDIFITDLFTGVHRRLVEDEADQQYPAIDGNRVVWHSRLWKDKVSGNWDVYLHDLATGTTQLLSKNMGNQERPYIDGSYVIWAVFNKRYP